MKKLLLLLSMASLMAISACKKDEEPVKGCTDKDSKNYNANATVSDGSCQYEGNIVLWYDQSVGDYLSATGVTALSYYVDGKFVGSTGNQFYSQAPNCGQNASMTITKDLGGVKVRNFPFKVLNQNGDVEWEGELNFEANTCIKLRLTL